MLLRISKIFEFQMAHSLSGYDGKCSNIHGHNYRFVVTLQGQPIDNLNNAKNGMVIDFGDVKHIVQQKIIDIFDHALVVPQHSPFASIEGTKKVVTDFQPTSENLLIHFASLLEGCFPERIELYSLRLYETDTSYAELICIP